MVTDRGSEYKSEHFEQITELGVKIINLPAYRAELKGPVEKYLDLKHSFERLKGDYNRLQQKYVSLDQSFDRVQEENRELKAVAKDYDTLCRGYGEKEIAARVRAIQEQEAAARQQRRMERQHRYEIGAR